MLASAQLNPPARSPPRKRDIISRICAAICGGYVTAAALSVLLARLLPLPKAGAATAAILSTPLLCLCAILWTFAARSPSRARAVLGAVTLAAGVLSFESIVWSGR